VVTDHNSLGFRNEYAVMVINCCIANKDTPSGSWLELAACFALGFRNFNKAFATEGLKVFNGGFGAKESLEGCLAFKGGVRLTILKVDEG
jgi:hypothetical protein